MTGANWATSRSTVTAAWAPRTFYQARRAVKISEPTERDVEEPEVVLLTRVEVEEALAVGQFKALPWSGRHRVGAGEIEGRPEPTDTDRHGLTQDTTQDITQDTTQDITPGRDTGHGHRT